MALDCKIPDEFIKAFALESKEVPELAEKINKVQQLFQPTHLLALQKRVGKDFDKTLLFKIYDHENAGNFIIACAELPYLPRVEITREALEKLLDDSTFWPVFFGSQGYKEVDQETLLRAYFRGAYHEAMERRQLSTSADRMPKGFTKEELYPQNNPRWQKKAQQSAHKPQHVLS